MLVPKPTADLRSTISRSPFAFAAAAQHPTFRNRHLSLNQARVLPEYATLIDDHQVRETLQITDRSYVVVKGQVLVHGTPQDVIAHPTARELYFGTAIDADIRRAG